MRDPERAPRGSSSPSPYRTALRLEYFTVGYNILEAAASITFGTAAGSIALVGFGLDSVVESLSGVVLVWRLTRHERMSRSEAERVERTARRFVALTFFILGMYVLYESLEKLIGREPALPSPAGIIIALLSLIIMPVLARRKEGLGIAMGSRALVADSRETLACAFLSAALLAGLLANYLLGFSEADPLAGLLIVLFLFREGYEGWQDSGEGPIPRD
jgi:divalent metal cation (Fe/Co/Zn/Cd) transporter